MLYEICQAYLNNIQVFITYNYIYYPEPRPYVPFVHDTFPIVRE